MNRTVKVFGIVLIAIVLCVQTSYAYEFIGDPVEMGGHITISMFRKLFWLPDEEHILFEWMGTLYKTSVESGEIIEVCNLTEDIDLNVTKTTMKTRLTPDGKGVTVGACLGNGDQVIFTVDLKTLKTTILADPGCYPTWSPDGRYLLYTDPTDDTDILYDTISDESENFVFPDSPDGGGMARFSACFGPNSEYIYFCQMYASESEGEPSKYAIARMPIHGGDAEILSDKHYNSEKYFNYGCNLECSRGGRWILYEDPADVLLLDTETGTVYNALTGELHTETRYTPSSVLYSKNDGIVELEYDHVPADPETDLFFKYCMPAFSPDGSQIVYFVDTVESDYRKAYIIDFDSSLYPEPEDGDLPLAVDDSQPGAFATLANFPNPFNPSTTIEFTLPEAGDVKLVIYDITGRKVRELADGQFSAGTHSLQWNACDDMGKPVSSGVYVSRLESGDAVVVNRMTLVR